MNLIQPSNEKLTFPIFIFYLSKFGKFYINFRKKLFSFLRRGKILSFLLFTPITAERELNTNLMCRPVTELLFWDFPNSYRIGLRFLLITVGYLILFLHWSIVEMSSVFHSSIAITNDFVPKRSKWIYLWESCIPT